MKGRARFSREKANRLRALISQVRNAPANQQKELRDQMRALGFYISDFPPRAWGGFTVQDFDELVRSKRIEIID